jgi:hypothetical protein
MNKVTKRIVRIDHPFRLSNGTRAYPAGDYEVTTEHEQLGDFTFEAFRRIFHTDIFAASFGEDWYWRNP